MTNTSIIDSLFRKLDETGLADLPGAFLYSDRSTLVPGKAYMLGYNPGGDPKTETNTPKSHLQYLQGLNRSHNEYVDGVWYPGGRRCDAGDAPLQRRVQCLLKGVGLSIRSVCASNLIFVRSQDQARLANASRLAEQCWAVHRFLLEQIQPEAILSIGGGKVFDFISDHGKLASPIELYASGHGNWQCQSAHVVIGTRTVKLVSLPHLSRYAIDSHPDVIGWAKARLGL